MKTITRRSFLKTSALVASAAALPIRSWSQLKSASETIQVACIGIGGRGADHISGLLKLGEKGVNVKVVALCDVDKKILGSRAEAFKKRDQHVETYTDIRKVLEDKAVDAVTIATPNHWHSLAAIWAVQAGKDVYVEKPVSHNVWEGRKLVEAARKHQKIVQTGTQSRSSFAIKEATEWVRAGNLGKLLIARGLCYKPRGSIGKVGTPQPPPPEVDYDLWCGPAPMDPVRRKRFHYDWHWFWNYGNGDLGNQGIHQMDIARWFLGVDELSPRVWSVGGRLGYEDDGETGNTQIIYHDYPKAPLIFEVRGLTEKTGAKSMDKFPSSDPAKGGSVGVVIHCEGGYVFVPNYSSATAFDKDGKEIKKWSGADDHYENFLKAVRSRKHTDLNADILEGHLSSALCHTGNISYRLGKKQKPGEILDIMDATKNLAESYERMLLHLGANDVDLRATPATLGVPLTMDPKTEKFIGNASANKLIARDYRKPYIVPEKV